MRGATLFGQGLLKNAYINVQSANQRSNFPGRLDDLPPIAGFQVRSCSLPPPRHAQPATSSKLAVAVKAPLATQGFQAWQLPSDSESCPCRRAREAGGGLPLPSDQPAWPPCPAVV